MSSKQRTKIPNFLQSESIEYQDPEEILRVLKNCPTVKDIPNPAINKPSTEYINAPVAFDIETSSFYTPDGEKAACMYLWGFGVSGRVWYGRTWEEFEDLIGRIHDELGLGERKKLFVYVHNLAFEFGFMQFRFKWTKVFSLDTHKPLYAECDGIVFRCSYLLTGYGLAGAAKNLLTRHKCEKLEGDLDYNLNRHSRTPIALQELGYLHNDIMVVLCLIQEKIEAKRRICWIPLTKTGYVREGAKKACRATLDAYRRIRWLMAKLILTPEEYLINKEAFAGGFVHANVFNILKVIPGVGSFDICSSYPAVMIAEMFPMGRGQKIVIRDRETFNKYNRLYCTVFRVRFIRIRQKILTDTIISFSKCRNVKNAQLDNGRIVSAEMLEITLTNVDFSYIQEWYEWDGIEIGDFYAYEKGYLPTEYVRYVISLFQGKSQYKGVEGKEDVYIKSKEDLNSCFGMCVMDPCRPTFEFDNDAGWINPSAVDIEDQIKKYNEKKSRFLFYPWGVFITAYAKRNLLELVKEAGSDHVYSDTDSDKILNPEKHLPFVEDYNRHIEKKIEKAMAFHGLPLDSCRVKNEKTGEIKSLGVFEYEAKYTYFKTLGAKRYMYQTFDKKAGEEKIFITVAGVSKRYGRDYIAKQSDPFSFFDNDMTIPAGSSGKNIHTYIDEPIDGILIDYTGMAEEYHEKSAVHLEESDYHLSIPDGFIRWIMQNRIEIQ